MTSPVTNETRSSGCEYSHSRLSSLVTPVCSVATPSPNFAPQFPGRLRCRYSNQASARSSSRLGTHRPFHFAHGRKLTAAREY
jgi:hypothetical protein